MKVSNLNTQQPALLFLSIPHCNNSNATSTWKLKVETVHLLEPSVLFLEEIGYPVAGLLAVALEIIFAIDVDEPESVEVAVAPLEVIHERPREVPFHLHPFPENSCKFNSKFQPTYLKQIESN